MNPQGTRLLRSWRHRPGQDSCEYCSLDRTEELSIDAIRTVAG